ncbi:hypothetical protein BDF20DRAFT_555573 [Mycotypha africana]|uniref:uncharacterized protein n=1 Tax=Mycotypha africana TaxID=64632 RepID=UPI002301A875|nr:uncharacterized protein BDF20DRAFT_555573 [Mycotypha africana]KAI8977263.1 hypothetical protein BDF20DRAFT_555573 [Mycotypha africana]
MYSTTATYQPSVFGLDTSGVNANAAATGVAATSTSRLIPSIHFDQHCLNSTDSYSAERRDSIDYSRRPSYNFSGLLIGNPQSEASYSDHEQQTPSPFNSYEDYHHVHQHPYHQQQQVYSHPLDSKRRLSTLVELNHQPHDYASFEHQPTPTASINAHSTTATTDFGYTAVIHPWFNASNTSSASLSASSSTTTSQSDNSNSYNSSNSRLSPMVYANPAVDMYSPQTYLNNNAASICQGQQQQQQQYHSLFNPMMNMMENTATDDVAFRERAASYVSLLSSSSTTSAMNEVHAPMTATNLTHNMEPLDNITAPTINSPTTAAKGRRGKGANKGATGNKPARSRGRRVSNSPTVAGQKVFTCNYDDCGKVFKRSEHLKRHIRSIHTLEKPFECPYQTCSKRFSRSDNLNQHIRIHRHTGKDKSTNNGTNSKSNANHSSTPASTSTTTTTAATFMPASF